MLTAAVLLSILALAGYGLWCLSHVAFVVVFGCGVAVLCLFGCCFVYAMLRQHRAVRVKDEEQRKRVAEALSHAVHPPSDRDEMIKVVAKQLKVPVVQ